MAKQNKKSVTKRETEVSQKSIAPVKRFHVKRIWIVVVFIMLFFGTAVFVNHYTHSPEREARKIVSRAIELVPLIPDPNDQKIVLEILTNIEIAHLTDDGRVNYEYKSSRFFLVLTPEDQMPGYDKKTYLEYELAFSFLVEDFEKVGKVAILMNMNLDRMTKDPDMKATALIHEALHAIQANKHMLDRMTLSQLTQEVTFADEQVAWAIQTSIYKKIHPEFFVGATCNCQTYRLKPVDEVQSKVLDEFDGDHLIRTMVMYSICGDAFLRKLYIKK